jgi:hypothetical protein
VGSHWHLLSSLLTAAVVAGSAGNAHAYDCARKYCTRMESCGEAYYKFTVCHQQSLDHDNDGIPCENVCGGDMATFEARLRHDRGALTTPEQDDKAQPSALMQGGAAEAGIAGATCGSKRRCKDMLSCEEARFYLTRCGVTSLDRDGDGVPCESLCHSP